MKITSDWHIHTINSCDQASMRIETLIAGAREKGIVDYGITDHYHTPINLGDIVASRKDFDAADRPAGLHFGIEASVISRWEYDEIVRRKLTDKTYGIREGGPAGGEITIDISPEFLERFGVEYVVGGTHWHMYLEPERDAIIRDFHRQYMFVANHPLVDIVAHPWWWHGYWMDEQGCYKTDPWLDDFEKIPRSMHDEFAAATVENGKAVEINISAILLNKGYPDTFVPQYLEYLARLKDRGVTFSIGSDCHSATYTTDFERAAEMLETIGIRDEDLWRLPPGVHRHGKK